MLTPLRRIAMRQVMVAPLRAALIVLGVALGVALQIATGAASRSVGVAFTQMVQQLGGKADLTIVDQGGSLTSELTSELSDLGGVAHASALVEIPVRDPKSGRPLLILGIDFLGDAYFLPFDVASGDENVVDDPLAFANDPHALLIPKTLARRSGLRVGDNLPLRTSEGPAAFHVRGILEDSGPAAAFDGQVVIMFLDAAQVAFARGTRVDRIQVAFAKDSPREATIGRIRKLVGERGKVELPEERQAGFVRLLTPLHAVLNLAGVLALVVAMFLTYNAVSIAVAQRRVEIGIVRALGATRTAVTSLFCLEALLLAAPASVCGVLLGRAFAEVALAQTLPTIAVISAYLPLSPPPPTVDAALVRDAMISGIGSTLVAAFIPALRAAKVDPAITVRSGSLQGSERSLPAAAMGLAGLVLVVAAAVFGTSSRSMHIGFGASVLVLGAIVLLTPALLLCMRWIAAPASTPAIVRLGLTSVSRDLRRSTVSVVALAAAVTLSVTIGIWIASTKHSVTTWFERSLPSDLSVTAGSPVDDQYNIPFSDSALDQLRGVQGLIGALPNRISPQLLDGKKLDLWAFDSRLYMEKLERRGRSWRVLEGAPLEPGLLTGARRVALSESAARLVGRGAGERIHLRTPKGLVSFEVSSIIDGYSINIPLILLDRRWHIEDWGDRSVDSIDILVAPGSDVAAVGEAVRARLGGGEALFVVRTGEVQSRLVKFVDDGFAYARSIEWITLAIALMGVMGTMLAVVLDRRRELGVLRAIGATRLQVALSVTAEAVVLGLAAVLLGFGCGAVQGYIVVNGVVGAGAGWELEYVVPPWLVARVSALVVLSTLIASLVPAYRAARVEVTRAVGYE